MEKKKTTKKENWWQRVKKWIGTDGLLHFCACFIIAVTVSQFTHPAIGLIAALAVGFVKEIVWDAKMGKGAFEWHDIICDIIGAVLAAGIVSLGTYL